jgi:hypoxanthine phosphoribosyltransferase
LTSPARVLADRSALGAITARLGAEIGADHPDGVVMIGVLKGSIPFLADLARAIPPAVSVQIDMIALSAFAPDSGRVRIVKDVGLDVTGLPVVLVQDVVDTGLTTSFLVADLRRRGARSVDVCALADRRGRRLVPVALRHIGLEVGDDYLVGFGLDHDGRYRNLPVLAVADPAVLAADPDAYVEQFYGGTPGSPAAG